MKLNNATNPHTYAVIFTSLRTDVDEGYQDMGDQLEKILAQFDGFLGSESVRNQKGQGITVSYWRDLKAIEKWRDNEKHKKAKKMGKEKWYQNYTIRFCEVFEERRFISE